ncbi:hypothetical protein JZ751_004307 [Albula glossodonta]|uniref:Leucine-rich repeat-containing protein 3 n=1 Tax=Albula glossodonta TaxID=121402 RepID=A0A8T2N6T3_9TELE|nr:hypothetical protein JZ751_004307 [Albula glossodonta]
MCTNQLAPETLLRRLLLKPTYCYLTSSRFCVFVCSASPLVTELATVVVKRKRSFLLQHENVRTKVGIPDWTQQVVRGRGQRNGVRESVIRWESGRRGGSGEGLCCWMSSMSLRDSCVPAQAYLLLQSLLLASLCFPSAHTCPKGCSCSRRADGLNVTCSHAHLRAVPHDLPPETVLLRLDHNQISTIPERAFRGLARLRELNLSHNAVETLGEGAFKGVEATLRTLDLSHNRITRVHRETFSRLHARVHVGDNPWHCDCALQQALRVVAANNHEVRCHSSPLRDHRVGQPFLTMDADLCNLAKRTTDYAMLVTMFGWFAMVVSYVVYYVRQNQEDARRHLEYLKSLPSKAPTAARPEELGEEASTAV